MTYAVTVLKSPATGLLHLFNGGTRMTGCGRRTAPNSLTKTMWTVAGTYDGGEDVTALCANCIKWYRRRAADLFDNVKPLGDE